MVIADFWGPCLGYLRERDRRHHDLRLLGIVGYDIPIVRVISERHDFDTAIVDEDRCEDDWPEEWIEDHVAADRRNDPNIESVEISKDKDRSPKGPETKSYSEGVPVADRVSPNRR